MNRLDGPEEVQAALRLLTRLLEARGAWLLRERRDGASLELRRGEWGLRAACGSLLLSYNGESGVRGWRVQAWRAEGEGLYLEAFGRSGARRALLTLVPRASVASAREAVADARRAECERLTRSICEFAHAQLERASLSTGARRGEPGRWARILIKLKLGERVAVTAPAVSACAEDAESFLTSALLWFARLGEGGRGPQAFWLAAPHALAAAVCERLPLLRSSLRERVNVYELSEEPRGMTLRHAPTLEEIFDAPAPRLMRAALEHGSELTESIVALAPTEIDVVRARHGETLRFRGLPFARVRRVAGREHLWFGVEGTGRRALFDDESAPDFLKLLDELKEHRRADAPEHRHALYRAAPEAWLEALLRRDVTRLDPGLRLAPLHAQFRASRAGGGARPVDLLALRRDGRLVVVELKVSEDAALALQGADYWRHIEAHRRAGHLTRARLFGDAEIADEPPLVYLAAPMLRFHRSFQTLARCLSPEIEMYRLDLNEDWRTGVRVVRLCHVNQ